VLANIYAGIECHNIVIYQCQWRHIIALYNDLSKLNINSVRERGCESYWVRVGGCVDV